MPIGDLFMKTAIIKYYYLIKKLTKFSQSEIQDWQFIQLNKLLNHAYNNTIYYKNLFDKLGITPNDIKTTIDLRKLPILTKQIIRDNYHDLIAKNIHNFPHMQKSTGGSTGIPLTYILDKKSWSYTNANKIVSWEKVGYNYGDKFIALGSTSLFLNKKKSLKHYIFYKLKKKIGLNGINMSNETCEKYVNIIKNEKIEFIYGYASAIYILSHYIIKNKINLKIKACFPTSEVLTENYRSHIIKAFNCDIIDCYGASDSGITAFSFKVNVFEVGYNVILSQEETKENIGKAIITDLFNYAMPFINYEIGDQIEINQNENINESYNGQIINKVLGRNDDVIKLDNGNILTNPGFTILFKDLPVRSYKVEQSSGKSLNCKIVKDVDYTNKSEELIIETLKLQAGENIEVTITYYDAEIYTNSGKNTFFQVN